jgi:Ran GTPase-activating protein (RanGAP) involved in mRNA processing and transport
MQLSSPDTKHILKVQLEDLVLSLGERTLATLGPLLSSFRNLEVLILRNCGVESVSFDVCPRQYAEICT